MSKKASRLVDSFQPEHYELLIDPDRDNLTITGSLKLKGQKKGRPSQRVTLHQNGLKITSANLIKHDKKGDAKIPVSRINHQNKLDEVRLHTDQMLYPGSYTIELDYKGVMDDLVHGAFVAGYNVGEERKAIVATDLESHHAREVLPCIDEPAAKATFQLKLISPEDEAAVSNTPILSQEKIDDKKQITTFEITPKMSTYLFCFVYGDLQSKAVYTKDGVEIRSWSTKAHSLESLDYGLDVAKRALEFFQDYYGVKYPLQKCDLMALPASGAGIAAMENWGIITFREDFLIAEPSTIPQSGLEYNAVVICHELSHQWFGNLVTMKWWDDLWLNESFARVMEYVSIGALFPQWHTWNKLPSQEGLYSLRRDSVNGVQPIKTEINTPEEIKTIFDGSIVYAKGGRVINMLINYVGEEDFRRGLKLYFEKHAYGNTTGNDLWAALGSVSQKDATKFIGPWLEQPGFPILTVSQQGSEIELSQSHYSLDPKKSDPERLWPIPLLSSSSVLPDLLITRTLKADLGDQNYIKVNQGAVGHYIVHYANNDHAQAIYNMAASKELNEAERLMLLSDSSFLARAGIMPFSKTLELLQYYDNEDSESVWDIIGVIIGDSRRFIDSSPDLEQSIKLLVRGLIQKQYDRLGWVEKPDEPSQDTKLRAHIIGLGVFSEHAEIKQEALNLFDKYRQDPLSIHAELRGVVLTAAVRFAHTDAFEFLLNQDETTTNTDIKQDIQYALTATRSTSQGAILLDRLQDSSKVRAHDVLSWLIQLIRTRHSQRIAWDWLKNNWDWIQKTFGSGLDYDYYPRLTATTFNTRAMLKEYIEFFEPKTNQKLLKRNIQMGIEELETRIAWIERDLEEVKSFFKNQPS